MDMVSRFDSIRIDGLFGKEDPIIIKFDDQKDPVKILFGVNGSGKTTIMKIIQHSYCWNPIELFKLPFKSITYILNRRGDYKASTSISLPIIKCSKCKTKGKYHPLAYPDFDDIGDLFNVAYPDVGFIIRENNLFCPRCNNKDVYPELDFTVDTDKILRDFISEVNEMFNQYEGLQNKMKELAISRRKGEINTKIKKSLSKTSSGKRKKSDVSIEIKKETSMEQKKFSTQITNLKIEGKEILHSIAKMINKKLPIILSKKFNDLGDSWDGREKFWGDGLSLSSNPDNLDLNLNRTFDFSTKLTITKQTKMPESVYFDFSKRWQEVAVGNYIQIIEEKDPIIEFSNPLINDLIELMKKIISIDNPSLKAESLDWGFVDLFDTSLNKVSIRMPDIYDYWDSDWDKIEQGAADYRITRFGDYSHQRSSVSDWIEINNAYTNEKIDIHDFLVHHLDSELVTHSKKGTRMISDENVKSIKEFSPNMKTPELISHLFDYQKVLISPSRRNNYLTTERTRNQYYVVLPKILNISTERKNDDDYFNTFSTNYSRIIRTCHKLVNSMDSRIRGGSLLHPPVDEERGALTSLTSELATVLKSSHNINLEEFIETVIDEIPGASKNHDIPIERILYFLTDDHSDYSVDQISTEELAEVISSIVKFTEVIKLKRYLSKTFDNIRFDLDNSRIYTGDNNEQRLKFSDISSGIRQKFRIITSVAMQVISADKSLILIDEPEISLHLSWQRSFVDDLLEFLGNLTSKSRMQLDSDDNLENIISIIISTHSPAILSNHYHRGQQVGGSDFEDE
jgi:hypothetical protein